MNNQNNNSMLIKKILQVHQKDSAFLYAILESLEGMAAYSTLAHQKNSQTREIELFIPQALLADMEIILEGMRKKIPILELEAK